MRPGSARRRRRRHPEPCRSAAAPPVPLTFPRLAPCRGYPYRGGWPAGPGSELNDPLVREISFRHGAICDTADWGLAVRKATTHTEVSVRPSGVVGANATATRRLPGGRCRLKL